MAIKVGLLALTAVTVALGAPAASAQGHHRHHRAHHQIFTQATQGYGAVYTSQAYGGSWEARAIAEATERAQNEPGVTSELAPDARQTATGGPVGGVPGFDGT